MISKFANFHRSNHQINYNWQIITLCSSQSIIIIINTYTINAFSYVNPQNIIDYLNNLCNNISSILSLPGLSQDFMNYFKLADSIDGVTTVMAALSTLTPSNATDSNGNKVNIIAGNSVLSSYASINSTTLLGGILNLIINCHYRQKNI
jgi:hypothetical protein